MDGRWMVDGSDQGEKRQETQSSVHHRSKAYGTVSPYSGYITRD